MNVVVCYSNTERREEQHSRRRASGWWHCWSEVWWQDSSWSAPYCN